MPSIEPIAPSQRFREVLTAWRFLKLEGSTATIDLTDYSLSPVEMILGILVWMATQG